MAIRLSKDSIHLHSIAWGLLSISCFILLSTEFIKNTLLLADALALSSLTVSFLIQSYYPICPQSKQKQPLHTHHKVLLIVCLSVFFMSFMVRFNWL